MTLERDDDQLETLFQAARRSPPVVPEALMAQVLQDAQDAQPKQRQGLWARFLQVTGGAPAAVGLATATCVGLWIGVAPPEVMPDLGGIVLGVDMAAEEDMASFGWDIEEG